MREIDRLVEISKYVGERFDLIQAGGGNSSVKLDKKTMIIKASGFTLSEVERDRGHVKIRFDKVLEMLEGKKPRISKTALSARDGRPSIETFLHSLLSKYTIHMHPVVVGAVACHKHWRETLVLLFKKTPLVRYKTPGIELALELKKEVDDHEKRYSEKPKVIFLQNHGLIVTSDDYSEVLKIIEETIAKIERHLKVDMARYKMTNEISRAVNSAEGAGATRLVSYLSCDDELRRLLKTKRSLFFTKPFCPDDIVYCGTKALEIKDIKRGSKTYPRVVICKDEIFFVAPSIKKAREIEEVFKSHLMILKIRRGRGMNFLSDEEAAYLDSWDAERYRRKKT